MWWHLIMVRHKTPERHPNPADPGFQTLAAFRKEADFRYHYNSTPMCGDSITWFWSWSFQKYTEILKWVLIITMLNSNLTKQRILVLAGFNTFKTQSESIFRKRKLFKTLV
jgi:hypothetical protein